MGIGWRFRPVKLVIFGVVIEVGQKLAIFGHPLLDFLKTSISPMKSTGVGW